MISNEQSSYNPQTIKILMVEDDEFFSDIILTKLRNEGYQIQIVHEGSAAAATAKKYRPSLILLDMMLPDCTGVDVLHTLKQDVELKSIPVIFFSNSDNNEDVQAGIQAGASKYLVKIDTEFELLAKTVREVIADAE